MADEDEAGDRASRATPPKGAPWPDVAMWRKAERTRLLAARRATPVEQAHAADEALARHVEALLEARMEPLAGRVVSAYWPIRGEPDLRPMLARLHARGAIVALPDVIREKAPLVFRRWTPETRMVRGFWNILVPPPEAETVTPKVAIAPLVGWSREGYRLGYGGGYFDRTLAQLQAEGRPAFAIGIGRAAARLESIVPQDHDVRFDVLVTEDGIVGGDAG